LQPWELLDADARAALERPVELFKTELCGLNTQLEKIHSKNAGFKQYTRTDSVFNDLNHIKSSLERAISDLTTNSVIMTVCSLSKSIALETLKTLNPAKAE